MEMKMEDRYLVAVDLGTAKIALSVAYVNQNGMSIVYYKELPSKGVRNSSIYNETQVSRVVKQLVDDAEKTLGIKITQVIASLPRNSIKMESICSEKRDMDANSIISAKDVQELKANVTTDFESDNENLCVYSAVAQSYSNGDDINLSEEEVVGTSGETLGGNFNIFIGNRKSAERIASVMHLNEMVAVKTYFTPEIIYKSILCEDETQNGVAVIDLGAGCSSVSIFIGGTLRFYSSIPFGGKEISSDIRVESNISEQLAENIKKGYGACMPEKLLNMTDKQLLIRSNTVEPDKRLGIKYLSEIITAREEEILEALFYEINRSKLSKQIPSGIVITGGGAEMTNIEMLITKMSGYKVRKGFTQKAQGISECNGILETSAAASVAMLVAAEEDGVTSCATIEDYTPVEIIRKESEIKEAEPVKNADLFADDPDYNAAQLQPKAEEKKKSVKAKESGKKKKNLFYDISKHLKQLNDFSSELFDDCTKDEL